MKKRLFSLGICLLLCLSLLSFSASAEYHESNTIETVRYDLNGGYILVQKSGGWSDVAGCIVYASPDIAGDVVLPEEVEGVPVTGILIYSAFTSEDEPNNAYGFNRCDKITSLTIPGTIKTISADAFPNAEGCTVILKEGVEELYPDGTQGLSCNIERLVLPKSLYRIDGRLSASTKLTIELDEDNSYFTVDEQGLMITADGKYVVAATLNGEEAKSYIIPYGVAEINYRAFRSCPALTDIYFPDSVIEIDVHNYTDRPLGTLLEDCIGKKFHARSGGVIEKALINHNTYFQNFPERHIEFVSTGEKLPYTDIGTGWAVPYIGWAFDKNVMTGTTDTTFSPGSYMTRGMAVTTLYRISREESDYQHSFTDVPDSAYYSKAVSWAAENSVVNGVTETQFAPGKNITREQLAVMLYRYAQYLEMDSSKRADLSKYTDAGNISGYALEAMQWANAEGIINGRNETTLSPKGITTRAEYAAVLQRLVDES